MSALIAEVTVAEDVCYYDGNQRKTSSPYFHNLWHQVMVFHHLHRAGMIFYPGTDCVLWWLRLCRHNSMLPSNLKSGVTSYRAIKNIRCHEPLTRYANCGLRMRWECRERFPRHRLQRKPLVIEPGMHRGTCVTDVSWCMTGTLTRGDGGNVPGMPDTVLRIW